LSEADGPLRAQVAAEGARHGFDGDEGGIVEAEIQCRARIARKAAIRGGTGDRSGASPLMSFCKDNLRGDLFAAEIAQVWYV
jgi:hypothetical protein